MADSLVVAESIELLGGSVPSAIPQCAGAIFRLQPGYDLSAPQPTTDIVGSLLLDGERPFGRRASNRTISLPIIIDCPDFATLTAAREVLLQLVDAQTWTLTWTRSGGLPIVFDCFRAEPTVVAWGGVDGWNVSPVGLITLTFQAMPYGRSDVPVSLEVASPLPGNPSPLSPVVIDNFSSVVAGQNWAQSSHCVIGPNSARFNPANAPISDPTGQAGHGATYLSAAFAGKDITGRPSLTVQAGFGTDYWSTWHEGWVMFSWTLTDGSGHTLSFSRAFVVHASNSPASPNWQQVTVPIPQGSGSFNYANVTRYQFNATNRGVGGFRYSQMYLDAVTANPRSAQTPAAVRGAMYSLLGIQGTARAPVSLQFQQAPGTGGAVTVTLPGPAGTPQSWAAPSGVTSVAVAVVAPGGIGGSRSTPGQAGGGGGGESAGQTVTVTPGAVSTYNLGSPGTAGADAVFTSDLGTSVTAHRGGSVAVNTTTGAAGGTGSAATGYHFNGGAGGTATGGAAGAGGGSAGSTGAGGAASGATPGAAGTGGGVIGGAAASGIGGAGHAGGNPGAGGGGANTSGAGFAAGGTGGAGQIKLTYNASGASAPFSTLIAHRPGPDAPQNLSPFVSFNPGDTPNGGTEYPVPSLAAGQFADFGGTYTVVAVANGAFSSPSSSRTLTITVKQYEYSGGPSYSTSCARTFTPNTDITNGIIVVGELTLPLKDTAPDNASGLYTVTISDTTTADSYLDCLFLDTMGSTVMVNIAAAGANLNYFVDPPAPDRDLGRIMGSDFDRPQAVSVLDNALVSGPPLSVDPGDNLLFAYCVEGAPAFSLTYSPAWWLDRLS